MQTLEDKAELLLERLTYCDFRTEVGLDKAKGLIRRELASLTRLQREADESAKMAEQLNTISELSLGYREGKCPEIIQAISDFKLKAMKYEFSENMDKVMELIDDLAELKEDILNET